MKEKESLFESMGVMGASLPGLDVSSKIHSENFQIPHRIAAHHFLQLPTTPLMLGDF